MTDSRKPDVAFLALWEWPVETFVSGCWLSGLCIVGAILGVLGLFDVFGTAPSIYYVWALLTIGAVIGVVISRSAYQKSKKEFEAKPAHRMRGLYVSDTELVVSDCMVTWAVPWNESIQAPARRCKVSTVDRATRNVEILNNTDTKRCDREKHKLIINLLFNDELKDNRKVSFVDISLSAGDEELWNQRLTTESFWILRNGIAKNIRPDKSSDIVMIIRLIGEAIKETGSRNVAVQAHIFASKDSVGWSTFKFGILGAIGSSYANWKSDKKLSEFVEDCSLFDSETGEDLLTAMDRLDIELKVVT